MENIVSKVRELWPGTVLVHGKARHSQSQGGIERLNRTVQEKLGRWMRDNNSNSWLTALPFVKWAVNTSYKQQQRQNEWKRAASKHPARSRHRFLPTQTSRALHKPPI